MCFLLLGKSLVNIQSWQSNSVGFYCRNRAWTKPVIPVLFVSPGQRQNTLFIVLYLRMSLSTILSLLASIWVKGKTQLCWHYGSNVAWCWAVVGVWQLAVEAGPLSFSFVLTALVCQCHDGRFFLTELRQGLFPLWTENTHSQSWLASPESQSKYLQTLISFCSLSWFYIFMQLFPVPVKYRKPLKDLFRLLLMVFSLFYLSTLCCPYEFWGTFVQIEFKFRCLYLDLQ